MERTGYDSRKGQGTAHRDRPSRHLRCATPGSRRLSGPLGGWNLYKPHRRGAAKSPIILGT